MKLYCCSFFSLIVFQTGFAQQLPIPRIELMSNIPAGYEWKDWKKTALNYDDFIFDLNKTGEYLPLVHIHPNAGVNYPEINHVRMDTYVGQTLHGRVAEAINIIPAIVGASLLGRDKTTHLNTDWVTKMKDFFNLRNGQNVYLNNYSANTGNDWWYETMPNVFFYQLLSLYPDRDIDFDEQFITVANRWLEVVYKLGGTLFPWQYPNMNYRAFNLLTGEPRTSGVPEPEAAGAIAWILYQAYIRTNQIKYRYGAELALDFLQNRLSNPSYEIQLPYGILTAAQMNAREGTGYDMDKMLRWAFSSGAGTLRGWGCIVGDWNGYEMSGLIGEANDKGNDYAFSMNGFQHAAALVPMVKYDKRYARAIAKWILNLSGASRYFYRDGLPREHQERNSYEWSLQYDQNSCIPYESIKENRNGVKPVAMGDAVDGGWAATNLSLYSGSSAGYLAALIEPTNVNGILQINLNLTDFRGNNDYPVFLLYNPHDIQHTLTIRLGEEPVDIYDCISETVMQKNTTGEFSFPIEADRVLMPVLIPSGNELETDGRLLKVKNGGIIDFHYGYNYDNRFRIKVFTSDKSELLHAETVVFNCITENHSETVRFQWYVNGLLTHESTDGRFEWKAPLLDRTYEFFCKVTNWDVSLQSREITIKVSTPPLSNPEMKKTTDPYQLVVYPNPAGQFFYVKILNHESIKNVEIINSAGQIVWKKENMDAGNIFCVHALLSSGLYMVRVSTTHGRVYGSRLLKE